MERHRVWKFVYSKDDGAKVILELNGTKKTIGFKKDANVTVLPSNVLTFERVDEFVYVDEDETSGKQKNAIVL